MAAISEHVWAQRHQPQPNRPGDERDPWQRDWARIIHSSGFRRLQGKTQVLGIGEGDFHRTRLTHSMEAAQIGRGIILYRLAKVASEDERPHLPPPDLISSICLAHDIGHPPFGHAGERVLNYCFRDHGGFEGNGHTLRLLASLEDHTPGHGLNLTRRTLLGLLKYPAPYSRLARVPITPLSSPRGFGLSFAKPPKCYLDSEQDVVDWMLAPLGRHDRELFMSFDVPDDVPADTPDAPPKKHGRTRYKSLDASLLDLADDIAYGVHDFEDAVTLGLIDGDDAAAVDDLVRQAFPALGDGWLRMFDGDGNHRKQIAGGLVNGMILSVELVRRQAFDEPVLDLKAQLSDAAAACLRALKGLVYDKVINSPEVRTLEYRGTQSLLALYEALSSDPEALLPGQERARYQSAPAAHKPLVIRDYIAAMTDEYATKMFERLFVPRRGTIFERL